jgi:hypothetical protein
MKRSSSNPLTAAEQNDLLEHLRERFEKFPKRHPHVKWDEVQKRLLAHETALWSLQEMERTGGEPDVVQLDVKSKAITFVDCSKESPKGRVSLCYDEAAREARKEHKPAGSAVGWATAMKVRLITESEYHALQAFGPCDLKTSSWIDTPAPLRALGGALFGDQRYGRVFIYHNGVQSYYAARGFRAVLEIP